MGTTSGSVQLYKANVGQIMSSKYTKPPCQLVPYTWWHYMGSRSWSRPTPEHRVQPATLWRYPTSRGPFFEKHIQYPIQRYQVQGTRCPKPGPCVGLSVPQFSVEQDPLADDFAWSNILAGKVKDLRVNLASDLAEYKESVQLAESLLRDLCKLMRKARKLWRARRNWSALKRTLVRDRRVRSWEDIPAAWLGINLATLPTLGTIADVIDKLNNPNSARPILRVIKFGKSTESRNVPIWDQWGKAADGHVLARKSWNVIAVVELQAEGLWEGNFTPGNPGEWLWEMIPLSFLLDYGFSVGQYLSALDAYSGINGIWGTCTTRTSTVARGVQLKDSLCGCQTPGFMAYKAYNRSAFTRPPPLTMPRWSPHPSVKRLITALSLFTTMRLRA